MSDLLVLSRSDLRALMRFDDYVDAVAEAFRLLARGGCQSPTPTRSRRSTAPSTSRPARPRGAGYVAVKINGNFPLNKARHGLPTIQGAVYLADASNGRALALLELGGDHASAHRRRDGGRGPLPRPQGRDDSDDLRLRRAGPHPAHGVAACLQSSDRLRLEGRSEAARAFARRMSAETGIEIQAVDDLGEATRASDAIVTCTTAREPFLRIEDVRPGSLRRRHRGGQSGEERAQA